MMPSVAPGNPRRKRGTPPLGLPLVGCRMTIRASLDVPTSRFNIPAADANTCACSLGTEGRLCGNQMSGSNRTGTDSDNSVY